MSNRFPPKSPRLYVKQRPAFTFSKVPAKMESPGKKIGQWCGEIPNSPSALSPPPQGVEKVPEDLEREKKAYNETFTQAQYSNNSSDIPSPTDNVSPVEMKLDEVADPLNELKAKSEHKKREAARIRAIRESWVERGMPQPDKWPRLKLAENYDEDPRVHKCQRALEEDLEKFKLSRMKSLEEEDEKENGEGEEGRPTVSRDENEREEEAVDEAEELREAERVIQQCYSEDNRFEASELIEYKNHDWCIALRIDREKVENTGGFQLLIYSYKRGIERIPLSNQQIDSLGTSLLIKYRTNEDGSFECLPIYSALPSTGLVSLKYRTNKGIELRIYGIVNFVDILKDPNQAMHKTMIWTDAIGPIWLTAAERTNIRRKLMQNEQKIFAPLRMCQMNVKGEFTTNVPNGTMIRWSIASFSPLIEETPKDPNIGRNFWPARIIRMDDLILKMKIVPREVNQKRRQAKYLQNHPGGGTLLTSHSDSDMRVFCGPHLTGILRSAGAKYLETGGIMMAFAVPYYQNREFAFYEALIAGPPRVVMLITEGRFLNYAPKTWSPEVQRVCEAHQEVVKAVHDPERRPLVREPPRHYKETGDDHRLKSRLGFEEMPFDF